MGTKGRENSKRAVSRKDEKRVHNVNALSELRCVYFNADSLLRMQLTKINGILSLIFYTNKY